MKIQKDFEELLRLLNENKVKYCIVGAYAVAFHGKPRYTKDLDVLIKPSLNNGKKIISVLNEFGFESLDLSVKDFTKKNQIIQLGYEPVRVDLLSSVEGCTFQEIWENKKVGKYGKAKAFFISKEMLIKNKNSVGRQQDLADLEFLKSEV